MAQFIVHIPSHWSPVQALHFTADLRNLRRWDPSVSRSVLRTGRAGELGSQFDVVVQAGLLPMKFRYQTTAANQQAVRVVAQTRWLRSDDLIEVRSDGRNGCLLTYEASLDLRGPLRVLDPLLGWSFDRVATRAAAGLKKVLQGPPPAAPDYLGKS